MFIFQPSVPGCDLVDRCCDDVFEGGGGGASLACFGAAFSGGGSVFLAFLPDFCLKYFSKPLGFSQNNLHCFNNASRVVTFDQVVLALVNYNGTIKKNTFVYAHN